MKKGRISAFRTSDHRPVTAEAVRAVGEDGSKALVIDGTASIDPYWMVRVCKKERLDERKVLKNIIINRAFTAYQVESIVDRTDEMLKSDPSIRFLGLIGLSRRFLDDDIPDEEGRCLRSQCIKTIKDMVEEHELDMAVADREPEVFLKRLEVDMHGKERADVPSGA